MDIAEADKRVIEIINKPNLSLYIITDYLFQMRKLGFKMVPIVPTDEMVQAGSGSLDDARQVWLNMVNKVPEV